MRISWLASLVLLTGCPMVGEGAYERIARDLDGDGSRSDRFFGPDCRDDDPSITICDADGDGVRSVAAGGDDCDDLDATVFPGAVERCNGHDDDCDGLADNLDPDVDGPIAFWRDADGDRAGDPDHGFVCQDLADPGNPGSGIHAASPDDCDDGDPTVSPLATERCDGIDNDCDGVVDDVGSWLLDADDDGYGLDGSQAIGPCVLMPNDHVSNVGGDCDDQDPDRHPGAAETPYDGVDANCNGGLDDWDVDGDQHVPSAYWGAARSASLAQPVPWTILEGDCDDQDSRVYVGAVEHCDGVDNDCDGSTDVEDLVGTAPTDELVLRSEVDVWYVDADGDGSFGTPVELCPDDVVAGTHGPTGDDCFDGGTPPVGFATADPATVYPGRPETCDGYDNDCNGRVDFAFAAFPGSVPLFVDADGDGFGLDARFGCGPNPALGLVADGGDCNDAAANVFPGAPEICGDAVRQDCSTLDIFDCDGDGQQGAYVGGGDGEDCEDTLVDVFSGASIELCDGVDNDCDGFVDSDDPDNLDTGPLPFWYVDTDGDGYGTGPGTEQCSRPIGGYSLLAGDCDDGNAGLSPATLWYDDDDGDGYGDPSSADAHCSQQPGEVLNSGDCNDGDPALNPATVWSYDGDGDGFGDPGRTLQTCAPPAFEPWVRGPGLDCADDDPAVRPGVQEIPGDGIDNDCDGVSDGTGTGATWYVDVDGDGFGDENDAGQADWAPGLVPNDRDCDDTRASVHPASIVELCDGLDNNCDGFELGGSVDVSNPWLGVQIADDRVSVFLAHDDRTSGSQPSLSLIVSVCGEGPTPTPTTLVRGDLGARAVIPFPEDLDVLPYVTCPDGTGTQAFAPDHDGDFAPGVERVSDLFLACGPDPEPSGYLVVDRPLDCAPYDPNRATMLLAGEYPDLDADGDSAPVPLSQALCATPGAVGATVAGPACDDLDMSPYSSEIYIQAPVGGVGPYVSAPCPDLTIEVQDDDTIPLEDLVALPELTVRRFRGPDDGSRAQLDFGSVTSTTLFRGVTTFDRMDVRPAGGGQWIVGLGGTTTGDPSAWRFYDSTLDGLSFELAGTAQVSLERSLVRSSGTLMTVFDDDARGRIEDSDIQGTPVLGLVQGGNLDVLGSVLRQGTGYTVSGGQLSIRDSRFENVSNVVVVTALGAPSRVVELVDTRIELFDGPNNVLVQQFGGEVLLDGVTIQAPALGASYAIDVVAGDLEVAGLDVEARQAIHVASPGTVHGASAVVDGRMEVAGELDLAGVRGGEQTFLVADGGVVRLSGFDLREVTGPPSPALAWGRVLNGGFMELEGSVLEGGAVGLRVESGQVSLIDSTVDTSGNALVVTPGVGVGALAFVEGSTVASSGFARAVEMDGGGLVAERSVFLSRSTTSTVHVTSEGEAWLARSTVLKQGTDVVGAVTLDGDAGLYATGSILWSDAPGVDTVVCSGGTFQAQSSLLRGVTTCPAYSSTANTELGTLGLLPGTLTPSDPYLASCFGPTAVQSCP